MRNIGDERAEALVQARGNKPFRSLAEFVQRTGLERRAIENLILAGAFDTLGERRQLFRYPLDLRLLILLDEFPARFAESRFRTESVRRHQSL